MASTGYSTPARPGMPSLSASGGNEASPMLATLPVLDEDELFGEALPRRLLTIGSKLPLLLTEVNEAELAAAVCWPD